jgi:hypothetical protein
MYEYQTYNLKKRQNIWLNMVVTIKGNTSRFYENMESTINVLKPACQILTYIFPYNQK